MRGFACTTPFCLPSASLRDNSSIRPGSDAITCGLIINPKSLLNILIDKSNHSKTRNLLEVLALKRPPQCFY